ncbi:hypothetical protein LTR37_006645 [Vermiconidia calcicola]|uniref:Uncharacterized protein n=1 Tax=Vermiconidia calcicola TaxID=1690605 RepID=A0ACC3NGE2_9PEZI|nr:hypothetical protein LTR37_006645 [Vermiconidia calcicola]
MAGKRRRSSTAPVEDEDDAKIHPQTQPSGKKPSESSRPRKAPRPSQIIIEIDTDEEERTQLPRLRGVLRGLHPQNVLPPPKAQETIEILDDDDDDPKPAQEPKHATRQSRYGRATETIKYDMKYHPMDEITRPKRAARRRSGSRSLSAAMHDGEETEEESLPSSAQDDVSERDCTDGESDGEAPRSPDPRASRVSARAAAQKFVNYSAKHHPQDYGLPGFQDKAKALKQKRRVRSKTSHNETQTEPPEGTLENDEDANESVGQQDRTVERTADDRRKKLRTLDDDRQPSRMKRRRSGAKKSNQKKRELVVPSSSPSDLAEDAISGSQAPQLRQPDSHEYTNEANIKTSTARAGAKLEYAARSALIHVTSISSAASDSDDDDDDDENPAGDLERLSMPSCSSASGQEHEAPPFLEDSPGQHLPRFSALGTFQSDDGPHFDGVMDDNAYVEAAEERGTVEHTADTRNNMLETGSMAKETSQRIDKPRSVEHTSNVQATQTSSATLAASQSRLSSYGADMSTTYVQSKGIIDNSEPEHPANHSEFEEQFAITVKAHRRTGHAFNDKESSEAAFDDLPVSQRERPEEQYSRSDDVNSTAKASETNSDRLPDTDGPGVESDTGEGPADTSPETHRRKQYHTPLTSFYGEISNGKAKRNPPEHPGHHRGENEGSPLAQSDGTNESSIQHATSKGDKVSRPRAALSKESSAAVGDLLRHCGQRRALNIMPVSDPTSVVDDDDDGDDDNEDAMAVGA